MKVQLRGNLQQMKIVLCSSFKKNLLLSANEIRLGTRRLNMNMTIHSMHYICQTAA